MQQQQSSESNGSHQFQNNIDSKNQSQFLQIQQKISQNKQNLYKLGDRIVTGSSIVKAIILVNVFAVLIISMSVMLLGFNKSLYNNKNTQLTVILLAASYNDEVSVQSVKSFLPTKNSVISNVIVGVGSYQILLIDQLSKLNITLIQTQKYPYQVQFLDQLIAHVQTQYFLFTTTDWLKEGQYFIASSIKTLQKFDKVSQVLPYNINTSPQPLGFSISLGVHRLKDYRLIQSYSKIVGPSHIINYNFEQKISKLYIEKGFKTVLANKLDLKTIQIQHYFLLFTDKKQVKVPSKQDKQKKQINKVPIQLNSYLKNALANLKPPNKIFQIQLLSEVKELPFCLLLFPSEKYTLFNLSLSISAQNYQNTVVIPFSSQLGQKINNYYFLKEVITKQCEKNSMVMLVNTPLKQSALKQLNKQHQLYLSWMTYSVNADDVQIYSFSSRIYELLSKNDFYNQSQPYLSKNDISIQTVMFLQLIPDFSKSVQHTKIYESQESSYFKVNRKNTTTYIRSAYQKITRLNENMLVDIYYLQMRKKQISEYPPPKNMNLTTDHMKRAVERQQQIYLPQNHSIKQLQFQDYNKKYNIGKYLQKKDQVRFCVTVLNRNNVQNDRYIKMLQSILQQKYENYHIVFIDDVSTDNNVNASIKYLVQRNVSKSILTFIQNKQRNFATFNILNSAFNYCAEDDVQMLIDGDDQFIGEWAFQVINSAYQQDPSLLVVYSNYKASSYAYGRSMAIQSENDHVRYGKRLYISKIGPIRTWKTKLLYNIPISHHKMVTNKWLDTVYDDALQHPIIQLAGVNRIKYIPQILYEYNVGYGDNDDSTQQKRRHRTVTYIDILKLKPLSTIKDDKQFKKDKDVEAEFKRDNGTKFQQLKLEEYYKQ